MVLKIVKGSENAPLSPLLEKRVAVLGYGNQGHAHALNLRDSGVKVVVANRPDSKNGERAMEHGFKPLAISDAVEQTDLIIMALPDEVQPKLFRTEILPHLRPDSVVGFLHGFSVRFDLLAIPDGVGAIMVAPKGPGQTLRDRFVQGLGIPCLFAQHRDTSTQSAEAIGLAWANGIGCARAGVIFTTFRDETDTDLFGEQAVLCGGMTQLMLRAFSTLVGAGYPPELAYLECCHEVKQIADLVYERGLAGMMQAISNTAEFGAYDAGPKLIDDDVAQTMRDILDRIQSGTFAQQFLGDFQNDFAQFENHRQELRSHPIEKAGETIRALMPKSKTRQH
jgi:ketol-acid reductoisomerase